jgi:hypothetical protein
MNLDIVAEQMKFAQIVNDARFCGAARSPTRIIEITIRDITQRAHFETNRTIYRGSGLSRTRTQEPLG